MKEILSADDASWPTISESQPGIPAIVSTQSGVSDLLEQHTVQIIDEKGNPTGSSVVLLANMLHGDE